MTTRMFALLVSSCLSLGCDPAGAIEVDTKEPAGPTDGDDDDTSGEIQHDDGETPDGGECATRRPPRPAARLMFVLDKSSSMGAGTRESAPALLGGPSRWERTHALVAALSERFAGEAQLGATLFPSRFADVGGEAVQCDVLELPDLPIGQASAEQVIARLPAAGALEFAGGSPASAAMWTALQHIATLEIGPPTAIVLVTDGGANCADDEAPLANFDADLDEVVAFAHDTMGVATFVVAAAPSSQPQNVPAVDARAALREIAFAGGVPHPQDWYFDVRDVDGLEAAIVDELAIVRTTPSGCP